MLCELCQSQHTIFEPKKDGLCPKCQEYLIPAHVRKEARTRKPYLIKGGYSGPIKKDQTENQRERT